MTIDYWESTPQKIVNYGHILIRGWHSSTMLRRSHFFIQNREVSDVAFMGNACNQIRNSRSHGSNSLDGFVHFLRGLPQNGWFMTVYDGNTKRSTEWFGPSPWLRKLPILGAHIFHDPMSRFTSWGAWYSDGIGHTLPSNLFPFFGWRAGRWGDTTCRLL